MYILGLATMGSSAACLFKEGTLIAAVEEERLSRIKNDGGFPLKAIAECLRIGGIEMDDVGYIAVYWQPWRLGQRVRGTLGKALASPGAAMAVMGRVRDLFLGTSDKSRPEDTGSWSSLFNLRAKLSKHFGPVEAQIGFFDHHLSHQLYAEAMRDWSDFVSLSYDGGGESASTVLSVVRDGRRTNLQVHDWPNSLGHFYSTFTGFLGFRMLEGEYKMMGLAPYGKPVYRDAILQHVLHLEPGGRYRVDTSLCDYHAALRGQFSDRLDALLCPRRAPDVAPTEDQVNLAASVQAAFEAAQHHVLSAATGAYPDLRKLVISGGCALNVTANGKLLQDGMFDEIIIPPAPHDAGCAIGAVLAIIEKEGGVTVDRASVRSPYLGAAFTAEEIRAAGARFCSQELAELPEDELVAGTARLLADGKIIAWFQGRTEFGPRALGARSFLADPRRDAIREEINQKIKKRELFRPFAPSVTEEAAGDYFEIAQSSPYMNIVARVRDEKAGVIPAVTHTDQTARVHSVSPTANPLYHKLLNAFGALTGVPVLLNTSFNIQEPIVYSPAEAFHTFAASGVDALVIGPFIVERNLLK